MPMTMFMTGKIKLPNVSNIRQAVDVPNHPPTSSSWNVATDKCWKARKL